MPQHIGPYRVEPSARHNNGSHDYIRTFSILRTGEGEKVIGDDIVFMNFLCDLLNEEVNGKDVHR